MFKTGDMKLFYGKKKNRSSESGQKPGLTDKTAAIIAGWMLHLQEKISSIMNRKFSKLGIVKRKIAVLFFCLMGGGLSIYYILQAAMGVGKEMATPAKGPELNMTHNRSQVDAHSDSYVDEETFRKVQFFEAFMDSLGKCNNAAYEKILTARPGLMDSIHELEKIYYSQKIK